MGEGRQISVSREITKMHEETIRGTVIEVIEYYNNNIIKGEIVIVIGQVGNERVEPHIQHQNQ